MFVKIIFIIMAVILVTSIIMFLIEAIYYDYQRAKFHEKLKPGDKVIFRSEEFFVYESAPEMRKVKVYNLFYAPMEVHKEDIEPVKSYKTVFCLLKRKKIINL